MIFYPFEGNNVFYENNALLLLKNLGKTIFIV